MGGPWDTFSLISFSVGSSPETVLLLWKEWVYDQLLLPREIKDIFHSRALIHSYCIVRLILATLFSLIYIYFFIDIWRDPVEQTINGLVLKESQFSLAHSRGASNVWKGWLPESNDYQLRNKAKTFSFNEWAEVLNGVSSVFKFQPR